MPPLQGALETSIIIWKKAFNPALVLWVDRAAPSITAIQTKPTEKSADNHKEIRK